VSKQSWMVMVTNLPTGLRQSERHGGGGRSCGATEAATGVPRSRPCPITERTVGGADRTEQCGRGGSARRSSPGRKAHEASHTRGRRAHRRGHGGCWVRRGSPEHQAHAVRHGAGRSVHAVGWSGRAGRSRTVMVGTSPAGAPGSSRPAGRGQPPGRGRIHSCLSQRRELLAAGPWWTATRFSSRCCPDSSRGSSFRDPNAGASYRCPVLAQ